MGTVTRKLLSAVAVAGLGEITQLGRSVPTSFQATGITTSGDGQAVVRILVSNDRIGWVVLGTIILEFSATAGSDGFSMANRPWLLVRAELVSISGTGAAVTVTMGEE